MVPNVRRSLRLIISSLRIADSRKVWRNSILTTQARVNRARPYLVAFPYVSIFLGEGKCSLLMSALDKSKLVALEKSNTGVKLVALEKSNTGVILLQYNTSMIINNHTREISFIHPAKHYI